MEKLKAVLKDKKARRFLIAVIVLALVQTGVVAYDDSAAVQEGVSDVIELILMP